MKRKKDGSLSFGIIFWVAVILLISVVFFINQPEINLVLQKTKFFEMLRKEDEPIAVEIRSTDAQPMNPEITESAEPIVDMAPDTAVKDELPAPPPPTEERPVTADPPANQEQEATYTTVQLYYLNTKNTASISLQSTTRRIPATTTPLTTVIQALLGGPTEKEQVQGYISLIPSNSQLLSAQVKDNIAYLNFNESFRFNPDGREGGNIQIMQVVFSATEFSTVDSVQFLVEGQVLEYLNGDGVFIGRPISKQNLGQVTIPLIDN